MNLKKTNMPQYTNSKGETIDTSTMDPVYMERALAKAKQDGNQDNIDALEWELAHRG